MAQIVSTSPNNGETEVYIGRTINVTFDVDMDPAYINLTTFVVYDQDMNFLNGVYTYDAVTRTAIFRPESPLQVRSTYHVVIVGGPNGVRTILDGWGNYDVLAQNYEFDFITNDGRFATPPVLDTDIPSGLSNIIYPSGYSYFSSFTMLKSVPADRSSELDPAGFNVDASGNSTITLYFDKPVDPATLSDVSVFIQDAIQPRDPFPYTFNVASSGTWTVNQWVARFSFPTTLLATNQEILMEIPTTVASTDGSTLIDSGGYTLSWATRLSPMYIGANYVRLRLGQIIADVPDDTINRLINMNSLLANWFSVSRPSLIKPFWSPMFDPALLLTFRPAFQIDQTTGQAPLYVQEYVCAKTMLDLLKARFYGFIDGVMLGGGPGASKALADLRISSSNGTMYAATIGPLINQLEGGLKAEGSVHYWCGYITGEHRWKSGFALKWGPDDLPHRAAFLLGNKQQTGGGGGAAPGGGAGPGGF